MNKLVANMLVKLSSEDDKVLLQAALTSIVPVCDHVIILDTTDHVTKKGNLNLAFLTDLLNGKVTILQASPNFCSEQGFAAARNLLLDEVEVGDYLFWVDSDEVHFTEQLRSLRENILVTGAYDDVQMHFIHFTLGANAYEKFEPRTTIVRKTLTTKWVEKVHERLEHSESLRKKFFSDYSYHHYGYIRDQETVFQRWKQYTELEDKDSIHLEHEYPDHNVLNHRRDSLIPYFGEYPSAISRDWIQKKLITL